MDHVLKMGSQHTESLEHQRLMNAKAARAARRIKKNKHTMGREAGLQKALEISQKKAVWECNNEDKTREDTY